MKSNPPQKPNIFEKTQLICLNFFYQEKKTETRRRFMTLSSITLGLGILIGVLFFTANQTPSYNAENFNSLDTKKNKLNLPFDGVMKNEILMVHIGPAPARHKSEGVVVHNYEAYEEYVNHNSPFSESESTTSRSPSSIDSPKEND